MAKRQTAQYWQEHVDGWARSGLTGLGYSAVHGVSAGSLYAWKNKLSRDREGPACRDALLVGSAEQNAMRFVPAKVTGSKAPTEGVLEVVLGNGRLVRIRGLVEAEVLERTVLALEGHRVP